MISLLLVLLNFLYEILNFLNMFFSRNAQDVTSTLQCKPIYQPSDGKIQCHFTLHNNGDGPIWVSKWLTPLEGIQSNCLRVMRNGKNVRYDGILLSRRFPPPSMSYVRISSKGKVSTKFDLSKSYRINEPGIYTVSVDIKTLYFYPNFFAKENLHKRSLISPAVTFMNMQPASNPYKNSTWFHMCEISHVNLEHVIFHMWNFTCETHNFTCSKFTCSKFTCEISHVKFHMWNT